MILGILILAFILWLSISFNNESTNLIQKNKPEKVCPNHSWTYFKPFEDSQDEQIICTICNKTPTQIVGEGGIRE